MSAPVDVNVDLNVGGGGFSSDGEYLPIVKGRPCLSHAARKLEGSKGYVTPGVHRDQDWRSALIQSS